MQPDPTTAQLISESLLRVCQRSAFFATLALFARIETSEQLPTAATDGQTVFVNPAFFGSLTPAERDGLLLHEVLHAALHHVPRRAGRDAKRWNIAADIVVNGMLLREGYTLPSGGLRDTRLEHLSTEEVYEQVSRQATPQPAPWADLADTTPADGAPNPGTASGLGQPGMPASHGGYWQNALEQAQLVARSTVAGSLPAGMQRELGNVGAAQIDWRSYLWRYLTQTPTDFSGFDRRFIGQGLYLDALAGESVQVLVAIDTSGSVDGAQLDHFAGELRGILHAYPHLRCELYYADAEVHGPYPLRPHGPLPAPVGGGGTDFRPFFQAIARHQFLAGRTVAIYLTDGYGPFPETAPRCPVLWVVPPGGLGAEGFPFGEVVRLVR